jgi:hypothetical protein
MLELFKVTRRWDLDAFCVVMLVITGFCTSSTYSQTASPGIPSRQYRTRVDNDYRVVIDSDGVSPETELISRQLDHMFDRIAHQGYHRIVLFIHGGLVTLDEANKTAESLRPILMGDDPTAYPIFFTVIPQGPKMALGMLN